MTATARQDSRSDASVVWTADRIATVRRLWISGRSFSFIANAIATPDWQPTRSAVCGKIKRLGLMGLGGNQPAVVVGDTRERSKAPLGPAFWTEERVEILRRNVAAGSSVSQTARILGVSINTVKGKAQRLGVGFGGSCRMARVVTMTLSKINRPKPQEPPQGQDGAPVPGWLPDNPTPETAMGVPFVERTRSQCAWPLGDWREPGTMDMQVCGRFVEGETSYCGEHLARSLSGVPLKALKPFDSYSIPTHMVRAAPAYSRAVGE